MKSTAKPAKKPVSKPKQNLEFDPNQHLIWSTKKIIFVVTLCIIVSVAAVFGFLAFTQYRASQIAEEVKAEKPGAPDSRHYANNYWGIEFDYPGTWTQPIGSYADGEYYYSSQAMNFIGEMETGEALIALKTFNNWNSLPLEEWLKSQQWTFVPEGTQIGSPTAMTVNGMPAQRYTLHLKTPKNNTSLWDMVIISRSTATKYIFILETDNEDTQKKFEPIFENLLSSITYRTVESNP